MNKKTACFICGGKQEDALVLSYIKKEPDVYLVAVDKGLEFFIRNGLVPDLLVGDFDSLGQDVSETPDVGGFGASGQAGMGTLARSEFGTSGEGKLTEVALASYLAENQTIRRVTLNPEKDDTDTAHALQLVLEEGVSRLWMFGATGRRMDHFFANVDLLGLCLKKGVEAEIIDSYNRIRMIDGPVTLKKDQQFGTYISLIPVTPQVKGLTLEGFAYPLRDYNLNGYTFSDKAGASVISAISNELVEEEGRVSFEEGILLLIESRDN